MDKVKAIMAGVREVTRQLGGGEYISIYELEAILTDQLGEEPAPPEDTPEQKLRRMFQDVEYNPDPVFVLFRNQITKRKIEEWWEHLSDGNKTEERDCFVGEVFDWLDKDGE